MSKMNGSTPFSQSDQRQNHIFYLSAFVDGVRADASVHLDVQRWVLTPQPTHLGTQRKRGQVEVESNTKSRGENSGTLGKQKESDDSEETERSFSLGLEAAPLSERQRSLFSTCARRVCVCGSAETQQALGGGSGVLGTARKDLNNKPKRNA